MSRRGIAIGGYLLALSAVASAGAVDVAGYYTQWAGEAGRLFTTPDGIVERLRTESMIARFVPAPSTVIYDVGGGAGVYAFPLAQQGYTVHLLDITPLHIEQARAHMHETGIKLAECAVGDARHIEAPDGVADAVLLLGPLYHLREADDRAQALREAYRILKPGGVLLAAAIARYAVLCDFGSRNELTDPYIIGMIEATVQHGKSDGAATGYQFFTPFTYFHHPDELAGELRAAGFQDVCLLSIEGPSLLFAALSETVQNPPALATLVRLLELIETDRSIMGIGGHIMAIGRR
jgi:ubiquinone/menaquinone biosynthesis C-methylase UbiE